MLNWQLPPNYKNGFSDCYNASIYTTVFNFAEKYTNLFGCHFGFYYEPADDRRKLEDRFRAGGLAEDRDDMLPQITGLRVVEQTAESVEALLEEACCRVQNGAPVTIKLDAYDCSWNIAYQKTHFEHYLCLLGKDGEDALWGHDAFCGVNKVKLPAHEDLHISKQYLTYQYDFCNITVKDPQFILEQALYHYLQKKCVTAVFCFTQELLCNNRLYEELKDSGVQCVNAFFIKLKGIVSNRLNFLYFLREASIPNTGPLATALQAACSCWYEAYRVLNKYMIRRGDLSCLQAACKKMNEAASAEARCAAEYLQTNS